MERERQARRQALAQCPHVVKPFGKAAEEVASTWTLFMGTALPSA